MKDLSYILDVIYLSRYEEKVYESIRDFGTNNNNLYISESDEIQFELEQYYEARKRLQFKNSKILLSYVGQRPNVFYLPFYYR